jgi:hypothetical protein
MPSVLPFDEIVRQAQAATTSLTFGDFSAFLALRGRFEYRGCQDAIERLYSRRIVDAGLTTARVDLGGGFIYFTDGRGNRPLFFQVAPPWVRALEQGLSHIDWSGKVKTYGTRLARLAAEVIRDAAAAA